VREDFIVWHFEILPEGDRHDGGVVYGRKEGHDGAVGGDEDGFVGMLGEGMVDGRFKAFQSLCGRFEAEDELGGVLEEVSYLLLKFLLAEELTCAFVFVEVFGGVAGEGQGVGDDLAGLGGFGFGAGDDDLGIVLAQGLGELLAGGTAVFA
jgi:hypothetical protein